MKVEALSVSALTIAQRMMLVIQSRDAQTHISVGPRRVCVCVCLNRCTVCPTIPKTMQRVMLGGH